MFSGMALMADWLFSRELRPSAMAGGDAGRVAAWKPIPRQREWCKGRPERRLRERRSGPSGSGGRAKTPIRAYPSAISFCYIWFWRTLPLQNR